MTNKIFQNTILLFITVFMLNSCTKDDDGGSSNGPTIAPENIVGLWYLDYYIENNMLTEEVACNRQLEYRFLANNTYTLTSFAGDDIDNCQPAIILNGTWEFIEGTTFSLRVNGDENANEIEVTYQDNFTKFIIVRSSNLTEVYSRE